MGNTMRLGVLDLGSNSFRLLAAEAVGPHELIEFGSRSATLCIESALRGQDGLQEHAKKQALDAIGGLIRWARSLEADLPIAAVGKQGLQDSPEGFEFLKAVQRRYGLKVELLSGEDEAKLTYRGVRSRLSEFRPRLGVIDIGGGSVEVSVGQRRFCFLGSSLPIGFLRVQHLDGAELVQHVEAQSHRTAKAAAALAPERWLLSGGTSRAFGRVAMARSAMQGGQIDRAHVRSVSAYVQGLSADELGRLGVPANRVTTFARAAQLLEALVEQFDIPAIGISTGGLRQGLVLREYERAGFAGGASYNQRSHWDGRR